VDKTREAIGREVNPAKQQQLVRPRKVPHRGFAATQNDMCKGNLLNQPLFTIHTSETLHFS
jgi:hypothetical protein